MRWWRSRPGRPGPLARWVGDSGGGRQDRGRVAIGTPELVVLQPTAAGLSCRQRQGGTIPRSRAQVRGVFPGGRAHRAAVGLQDDVKQRAGRSQPVGLLVVGELAEQVVRGWQIRKRVARRSRWWAWIWVGSPRWCARRVVQRVRPRRAASSRLGDEGQLRDCEGASPLQPGSLILIRDTEALRLECYSRRQLDIGVARQVVQARPNCH